MGEIAGQAVASGSGLYEMMHNGPGTPTLDEAHRVASAQATEQIEINEEVSAIAAEISAAWTGKASDGAQGATQPLIDGARQSSEALREARQVHSDQGGQFVRSREMMDPLPASSPETNVVDTLTPWDTNTEVAVHKYNETSANNVRVYSEYGDSSNTNESAMPRTYADFPVTFGGEFSVASRGEPGGTSASDFHSPGQGGPVPGGGQPGPGGYNPSGGGIQAPPSVGSGQPGPGGTTGAGPAPGGPGGPAPIGPRPGPGGAPMTPFPPGFVPGGAGDDTVRGGRGGGRGGGSMGTGRGGAAAEAGRGGSAGAGRAGAGEAVGRGGSAAEATGRPGMGQRVGTGVGAAAAAEAAAARGASAAGRPGGAGMPMGAGAGNREEDKEHKRKSFLEEPDAEGAFGTDERTAPPVIGDER